MAFALPQAGEFGFVLFSLAVTHRVMDPSLAEMLVIVVTISMIVSPLLMSLHTQRDRAAARASPSSASSTASKATTAA